MVLIGAAIGLVAKHFGSKRDDGDDDVQGDHPVVRALFGAVNSGDFDSLAGVVDNDCEVYANGYLLEAGTETEAPGILVAGLKAFHEEFDDLRWELYDELQEEVDGKTKIAIRFVFSAAEEDWSNETEVGAFMTIADDLMVEWREVMDMELHNRRRAIVGLDPVV